MCQMGGSRRRNRQRSARMKKMNSESSEKWEKRTLKKAADLKRRERSGAAVGNRVALFRAPQ